MSEKYNCQHALVASDNFGITTILEEALEDAGFNIEAAHTGEGLLRKLQLKPYGFFVLLIELGGEESWRAIRAARRITPDLPIVAIGEAPSDPATIALCNELACDFLELSDLRRCRFVVQQAVLKQRRCKVVIVDDELDVARANQLVLRRSFDVDTHVSGQSALESIQGDPPALVILDLKLKDIDGRQLLHEIMAMQLGIPVLVITGHPDESLFQQLVLEGASEVIAKGFDIQRLPDICRRVISQATLLSASLAAQESFQHLTRLGEIVHKASNSISHGLFNVAREQLTQISHHLPLDVIDLAEDDDALVAATEEAERLGLVLDSCYTG